MNQDLLLSIFYYLESNQCLEIVNAIRFKHSIGFKPNENELYAINTGYFYEWKKNIINEAINFLEEIGKINPIFKEKIINWYINFTPNINLNELRTRNKYHLRYLILDKFNEALTIDEYPYMYTIKKILGLSYDGGYQTGNPTNLYSILHNILGDSNSSIVFNKLLKIECRQIMGHYRYGRTKPTYKELLEKEKTTEINWYKIFKKLPYTGYMYPKFTMEEVHEIISVIKPYINNLDMKRLEENTPIEMKKYMESKIKMKKQLQNEKYNKFEEHIKSKIGRLPEMFEQIKFTREVKGISGSSIKEYSGKVISYNYDKNTITIEYDQNGSIINIGNELSYAKVDLI